MKVILLEELKGKGGAYDVVDVAPGFANNYLLPRGVAILATRGNLSALDRRKRDAETSARSIEEEDRIEAAEILEEYDSLSDEASFMDVLPVLEAMVPLVRRIAEGGE